ncbi:hypothetical protein K435DRAFT_647562 [Dendrothele bispora CBS 962.96]|uniref:PDZ GRASP-type domain-containing protein n=1 Tax=Dendrothele bispora (strain CBS 962.96) TaxID=1314807 RepID=A0A4V6T5P3_DENBC|nr:hypothetical protein K435DRAFT_647562 [Dendrothele bispora CBS 962.96]
MGASQSTSQAHPPSYALHVLRVTPGSPASQTSIEPFFDFIVGFEGDSLSHSNVDASELEKIVESHEGRNLNLLVWSSKIVPIIPSRTWSESSPSQDHQTNPQPSLLGLSMRMCEPEFALDNVWHVLDVLEGSPAESAGLVPYGDYITGWSGGVLSSENDFYDLVEAHVDKPLRVYVYSHDFDTLREVVLVPNRHWGGDGLLGCVFGYGLLHRIPPPGDHAPGTTPPELTEPEDEYEEQQFYVPADSHPDSYYNTTRLAEWQREEEEARSREQFDTPTPHFEHGSVSPIPEEDSQMSASDEGEDAHDTPHDTPRRPSTLVSSSRFKGSTFSALNGDSSL